MRNKLLGVIILCSLFFSVSVFSEQSYYFEEELLTPDKKHIYSQVQALLNDWSGESEKLEEARGLINSFLVNDRFYLPMHIENARYTIMSGYVGDADTASYNLKALKITQWVQGKNAKYSKSYVLAGHIYTNLQRYAEASASLDLAEKYGSNDPWLYVNRATLLRAQKRYEDSLQNYKKAIFSEGASDKSLVAAITGAVNVYKRASNGGFSDYSEVIFRGVDDPLKRIRIAQRLVDSYQGHGEILQVAYNLLSRQKQETPNLVLVDIEMARLVLVSGYKYGDDATVTYASKNAIAAKKMLLPLWGSSEYSETVFGILFSVAMSESDFTGAEMLVKNALDYGVPETQVLYARALIHFKKGEYESVISLHKEIEKLDPLNASSQVLAAAYERLGDSSKLQEFHLRAIERAPNMAWLRGNYAVFLMANMNSPAEAIKYGESALSIMNYPAARNITGLAYLVEASNSLSQGDNKLARQQYERAIELGVDDKYIKAYCNQNCAAIRDVRTRFSTKPQVAY